MTLPILWILAAGLLVVDVGLSVALTAVSALSRVSLRRMGAEWGHGASFLEWMNDPSSRYRTSALLLRQLCLLGTLIALANIAEAHGVQRPTLAGALAAGLVGVLLGEALLARGAAMWNPRLMLRSTVVFVRFARVVLYPVVEILHLALEWADRSQPLSEEQLEEEQDAKVEALIEAGERDGLLEADEGAMMRGIVDLDETLVREVMTPRTDIVALPVTTDVATARRTLLEEGHSRVPIYRESIDNIVGVLHFRDLFRAWEEGRDAQTLEPYLRTAVFVPETLSAGDLLAEMRKKMQLALVVDEYGGIAGLVTLEDLVEEIVGDIRDEHDEEEELVRRDESGAWIINAVTHVKELESLYGVEFEERDFDTVGGLVVSGFGRVPVVGERLEIKGLRLDVLRADRRRVRSVRVSRLEEPTTSGSASGDG